MIRSNAEFLEGKRILVVEDDYLIAQDLCDLLSSYGAEIVGPAGRVDDGLELAQNTARLDCAVLDLNLRGESAADIARVLRSRHVGVVIVSGYDSGDIAEEFADTPRLVKPVDSNRLCRTVEQEIKANGG